MTKEKIETKEFPSLKLPENKIVTSRELLAYQLNHLQKQITVINISIEEINTIFSSLVKLINQVLIEDAKEISDLKQELEDRKKTKKN